MLTAVPTVKFKKDYKRLKKRNYNMQLLQDVIDLLCVQDGILTPEQQYQYQDHALGGNYKGTRELHIQPDWVLIYKAGKTQLILTTVRSGTHADVFKE